MSFYLQLVHSEAGETGDAVMQAHGLTEHDIRAAHPHTSFPQPLTPADVEHLGYYPITPTPAPPHDPWTQEPASSAPVFDPQAQGGLGAWIQAWEVHEVTAQDVATRLADRKSAAAVRIDNDSDALIAAVIGNRASEYELAEREALAYKTADYPSDCPSSVSVYAVALGQSNQWAADNIINQAGAWRAAQTELRAQRLLHKAQASKAGTHAELTAIEQGWQSALQALKTMVLT